MAGERNQGRPSGANDRIQALVIEALDLLDASGSSPEAAAHLELALQELRKRLK